MPAVGDHVGIEIADHRRAAELAGQPVAESSEDRRVLPARARRRRPRSDPLGLAEQVASSDSDGTGGGEGERTDGDARPVLATSSASTSSSSSSATGARESCRPLTANAYSRNLACRVTLNRPSDGPRPDSAEWGSPSQVRITEFSGPRIYDASSLRLGVEVVPALGKRVSGINAKAQHSKRFSNRY
jgi:hypothetical protein